MKEKILETLRSLGFKLVQTDDENVYEFNYEGVSMLYMYNVNDEEFLNITVPCIMQVEEDNIMLVSALTEKVNATLKYIKAYIYGNHVWLSYERELIDDSHSEDKDFLKVVSSMILQLEAALRFFRKSKAEMEENSHGGPSDDDALAVETDETVETDN